VVAFTHLDKDHIGGASDFFYLEHATKYQDKNRIEIKTLWVPAAAIVEEGTEDEARIHEFFTKNIPGLTIPSAVEEQQNPAEADKRYCSAVNWLREQRRDKEKFFLIHEENIQSGFRRNLLGVKGIGIIFCAVALLLDIFVPVSKPIASTDYGKIDLFFSAIKLTFNSFSTWIILAIVVDILAIIC
jgi:hypothetical protein